MGSRRDGGVASYRGVRSMSEIEQLTSKAMADIRAAAALDALETLRVHLLGKQGSVTALLKSVGAMPAEQRKAAGEAINRAKEAIADAIASRREQLDETVLQARIASERTAVPLRSRNATRARLPPGAPARERNTGILARLGDQVAAGGDGLRRGERVRSRGCRLCVVLFQSFHQAAGRKLSRTF